jgi:AcrR family transcriptional regulator
MVSRMSAGRRRPGRPIGSPPNRGAILAAAHQQFLERGYEAATLRRIAAQAGVDPALVLHYFGSKERLFVASMRAASRPIQDRFIEEQGVVGLEGLGERLLRASLEWWLADPALQATAVAVLGAATRSDEAAQVMREITGPEGGILRLLSTLGVSQPRLRAALIGSTLLEVVVARLIVRLEPIASADLETLVSWYGPVVQGYLTRPLASGAGSETGADTGIR